MNISISKCLKHIPNRFEMIRVASKRAWDISYGVPSPLGAQAKGHKPTVVALMEMTQDVMPSQKSSQNDVFFDDDEENLQ